MLGAPETIKTGPVQAAQIPEPAAQDGWKSDSSARMVCGEAERLAKMFGKSCSKQPMPFGGIFYLIEQGRSEISCHWVALPPETVLSPEAFSLHYGSGSAEWHQNFVEKLRNRMHGLSIFEG